MTPRNLNNLNTSNPHMKRPKTNRIGIRRSPAQAPEQPWKSGPSRAASRASKAEKAFTPCTPPGLKPAALGMSLRGAEAPLFRGYPGVPARILLLLLIAFLFVSYAVSYAHAQVTFERLLNSAKEPQNWLTYSGDYAGHRFSPLDQVNTTNAHSLVAK